jgi:hypothetical protein
VTERCENSERRKAEKLDMETRKNRGRETKSTEKKDKIRRVANHEARNAETTETKCPREISGDSASLPFLNCTLPRKWIFLP